MARPFLIIDGYNLMHAAGMARRQYGPGELEKSRNELLSYLVYRLSPAERERTTIVFDAGDAPYDTPQQLTLHRISIVFATRGSDADGVIEELIAGHSAPRQIRLISSDHRLQKAARRRRATAVDSEVFFAHLQERAPRYDTSSQGDELRPVENPKFTGQVTAVETAAWLEIFGEADQLDEDVNLPIEAIETVAEDSASPGYNVERPLDADRTDDHADTKAVDINDAEWQKYLADLPDDLDELLDDTEQG